MATMVVVAFLALTATADPRKDGIRGTIVQTAGVFRPTSCVRFSRAYRANVLRLGKYGFDT